MTSLLRVEYQDQGWVPDRDAYYWRLRFVLDSTYLGVALGVIDGRALFGVPDEVEWGLAGPFATAKRLREAALDGSLRTEWALDAFTVPLTVSELTDPINRAQPYQPGEIVDQYEV
jgi:hypothetical protein